MTIKTLKMVRFGPYIKETVVDFEQFTGKVFLVSGDTGAGKTTIFDAVCYALYGEPSGSLRKNDTLRNQDSVKGDKAMWSCCSPESTAGTISCTATPGRSGRLATSRRL